MSSLPHERNWSPAGDREMLVTCEVWAVKYLTKLSLCNSSRRNESSCLVLAKSTCREWWVNRARWTPYFLLGMDLVRLPSLMSKTCIVSSSVAATRKSPVSSKSREVMCDSVPSDRFELGNCYTRDQSSSTILFDRTCSYLCRPILCDHF
jgi:hypothetical protein